MKYPKHKRYMLIALPIIILAIIVLGKCMATNTHADPTAVAGPPTLESYLIGITASIKTFQLMAGGMSALFILLIGALGYAYRRDIARVNEKAETATQAAGNAFKEINVVKRDFLSTKNHDRACPHINPQVDTGR